MEGGRGQFRDVPHVAGIIGHTEDRGLMEPVRLAVVGAMTDCLLTQGRRVGRITLEPGPLQAVSGEG